MDPYYFICKCGFVFDSLENWNCWDLIDTEVICPVCNEKYTVFYDAVEDPEPREIWELRKN